MVNLISAMTLAKNEINIPVQQPSQEIKESIPKEIEKDLDDKKVSKEELEKAINQLNELLKPTYTSVQFKLHDKTHSYYAVLVDRSTNEVIKEIPSKKMLDIYAAMQDFLGLIFDKKV